MFPGWFVAIGVAMAGADVPAAEGRDLLYLDGTTLDGNGPGGGIYARAGVPGPYGAQVFAGWTAKPIRLTVHAPFTMKADQLEAELPRLDARLLISDRRQGGLGVAADVDAPVPFVGGDPRWSGRLSLAVGKRAMLAGNVGLAGGGAAGGRATPAGEGAPDPLSTLHWGLGGAIPIVGPLTAFVELEAASPMDLALPRFGGPRLDEVRAGLHLAPLPPLVLTAAVAGSPQDAPGVVAGALWIPPSRPRKTPSIGRDRDHDGIGDLVDGCPTEQEDPNSGNDADGCPDGVSL